MLGGSLVEASAVASAPTDIARMACKDPKFCIHRDLTRRDHALLAAPPIGEPYSSVDVAAKQHQHPLVILWRRRVRLGDVSHVYPLKDAPTGALNESLKTLR